MKLASLLLAPLFVAAWPHEAQAVRFTLGLATQLTPIVIDQGQNNGPGVPIRVGFQPVIEVETSPWLSFGAYAPFTVLRTGANETASSSSGEESVFGLSVSGRWARLLLPETADDARRELLLYGTLRGGFGTVDGRAGPFLGGGIGAALTWLDSGRGLLVELGAGHVSVQSGTEKLDRWLIGLTLGVVFRLGGETFWLAQKED